MHCGWVRDSLLREWNEIKWNKTIVQVTILVFPVFRISSIASAETWNVWSFLTWVQYAWVIIISCWRRISETVFFVDDELQACAFFGQPGDKIN